MPAGFTQPSWLRLSYKQSLVTFVPGLTDVGWSSLLTVLTVTSGLASSCSHHVVHDPVPYSTYFHCPGSVYTLTSLLTTSFSHQRILLLTLNSLKTHHLNTASELTTTRNTPLFPQDLLGSDVRNEEGRTPVMHSPHLCDLGPRMHSEAALETATTHLAPNPESHSPSPLRASSHQDCWSSLTLEPHIIVDTQGTHQDLYWVIKTI